MDSPFYTEMRTRQQLGYIVWGQTAGDKDQLMAYFIIQSGVYAPDELERRADAFLATFPERFSNLTDEEFSQIKAGVRAKIEEKEKSISEKAGVLFSHAFEYKEDWDRKEETLRAIDVLTRGQVQAVLTEMLDPSTRRMKTILLVGREHKKTSRIRSTIKNMEKWKNGRVYR